MILAFKKEFVPKIKSGTKIHTIRRDKKREARAGTELELTHRERIFCNKTCKGTQRVFMTCESEDCLTISIDGRRISHKEQEDLAINSGFNCYDTFYVWFITKIELNEDEVYSGRIIHWTDKRY